MVNLVVFGVLILSFQGIINGEKETYIYVQENETVTLKCSINIEVWWVPRQGSLTAVVSGGRFDPNISKNKQLAFRYNQTANRSELQIREFTKEDEGLYKCLYKENGKYETIEETVLLTKDPKNIIIFGTDKNLLYAKSNHLVNLTCIVESGIPEETIIWMKNKEELTSGGPSSLTYTFKAVREDHLQNYSCIVVTSSISLQKSVQLFLYLPPVVHITQGLVVRLKEGTSLDLRCKYTSNNKIKDISWKYQNKKICNSSQLHVGSISREQRGLYSCTVVNHAGTVTANVTIEVMYPPDVTVSFSNNDGKRTLNCSPHGFPNRYYFNKWEHTTEFREHIRFLPTTRTGIIHIPHTDNETDRHKDSGIYICTVTNNVSLYGNTYVSAQYWLNNTGKPYFVTSNNATQYSILNQNTTLTADIVTFEKRIDAALFSETNRTYNYSSISYLTVRDTMYSKIVLVRGTRLTFTVSTQTADDIQKYTVVVGNSLGSSSYQIALKFASRPNPPTSVKFKSRKTGIEISWTPGFNGGYPQQFFVEYRNRQDEDWETLNASDETSSTIFVDNLEPGTEYIIRMFSRNAINDSVYTGHYVVETEDDTNHGLIAAIVFIVIAMIVMSFLLYQYKKGKLKDIRNLSCFRIIQVIRAGDIGGVENDMYEMQNNVQQQQPGDENPNIPVYSSIDRRQHLSIGNAVSYSVTAKRKPNPLGNRIPQKGAEHDKATGISTSKRTENEELNYIEVCFDTKPTNPFKIHGLEQRSDYIEVDFTKKVDPLPDSENDDVSDDDFVSLEDVKSMKRKTLAQI